MAGNKTTWKAGQSGNPNGRPPKSRALTDALAAAGKKKAFDADGKEIPRQQLLAEMVWQAAICGQVEFLGTNRKFNEHLVRADDRIIKFKGITDWAEFVKWLYHQHDGDLTVMFDDTKTGDGDGAPEGEADQSAVVILPDNGRSVQRPAQEEAQEQETEEGAPPDPESQETE